jgi:hypothetical protein
MWISKRVLLSAVVAGIAAMSMALAVGASGDSGHHGKRHGKSLIEESLAGSLPTDPTFHGVSPGGAPWVLKRGDVELKSDGELTLQVKGLVIPNPPGDGTPGGVATISASLYCGADADTTAADTTKQVPISRKGDARIRDKSFNVPSTCLAPVILVHPNGITARYIAAEGWRR